MSIFHENMLVGSSGQAAAGEYQIERSVRFNSADSAYLSRTPASAGNRKTWTWAGWVKRSRSASADTLHLLVTAATGTGSNTPHISFTNSDTFGFDKGGGVAVRTLAVLRDFSAWYHLVVALDTTQAVAADRCKLYINGIQQATNGVTLGLNEEYEFNNTRLHTIGTNANGIGTFNLPALLADVYLIDGQALDPTSFGEFDATTGVWNPKAYTGTYGTNGFHLDFADNSSAAALGYDAAGSNDWTVNNISVGVTSITNPQWYASQTLYTTKADILANATPKGTGSWTASDEFAYLVVNDGGRPGTDNVWSSNFSLLTYVYRNTGGVYTNSGSFTTSEGTNFDWTSSPSTYGISNDQDFYLLADDRVSGQPTANGYFSGTVPALITSSFRTLADFNSVNKENDSLVDTPTNYGTDTGAGGEVRGNYCTLNPLDNGGLTLSNGNLDANKSTAGNLACRSSIGVSSGKWYWEFTATTASSGSTSCLLGIQKLNSSLSNYVGADANGWGYFERNGTKVNSGGFASYGSGYTNGDIIGVVFDADNGTLAFYKNGVSQGTAFSGLTSGPYFPAISLNLFSGVFNFGQRPFAYTAPSGFKALCTQNLPAPTIENGSDYFDTVLYTGNDSTQTISGINFSPDFLWLKARSVGQGHLLYDTVRGYTKFLRSNTTDAEGTGNGTTDLTGFTSDGFTLGGNNNGANYGGATYAAWAWDAGSSTVTNNDGTISSQVRANPSAGFSIVTYTTTLGSANYTVGHGLGVAPQIYIVKNRLTAANWLFATSIIGGAMQYSFLNTTNAFSAFSGVANPTSTVFSPAQSPNSNWVAYCFAPVEGYSSMGSYNGNNSADGPFVFTGFRPAYLILKSSSSVTGYWMIYDNKRITYNLNSKKLSADTSLVENDGANFGGDTIGVDFLSNGFKIRTTGNNHNNASAVYVYAAFAEHPFALARAR